MIILLFLMFNLNGSNTDYLYDDEEVTNRPRIATFDDIDFEPFVPPTKDNEKLLTPKNINCEHFSNYAINCTIGAALIYNSTRISPPMPSNVGNWCRAIRHITNCAIDWNSDCKDITENHFNDESIKGHMHVLKSVCDDERFITQYDDLSQCIENTTDAWEKCYSIFKAVVDAQKNTSQEWTHYETHFNLCCARALFRRCTLTALFESTLACPYTQAVTLQKFSVIVSEGEVYQDCEQNMMYSNCPGGDPRPDEKTLKKLMNLISKAVRGNINNIFIFIWILHSIPL